MDYMVSLHVIDFYILECFGYWTTILYYTKRNLRKLRLLCMSQ
jgi:hypothetical protein